MNIYNILGIVILGLLGVVIIAALATSMGWKGFLISLLTACIICLLLWLGIFLVAYKS